MASMLNPDLPKVMDAHGSSVPEGFSGVIDAHVHVFPRGIFSAIWKWFEAHAWNIRYQLSTDAVFEFLWSRGIGHIIALQYAHKPGMAAELNRYLAAKCRAHPGRVTGMATVFPGEANAVGILQEAFDAGLGGVKLHQHVQCFDMNADEMDPIYELCAIQGKPMVMHVGREPKSLEYACDPYELCRADKLERVIRDFPRLRVCVPHMGFDETSAYRKLIEQYDNLWLDTTMVLTDYFPMKESIDLQQYRMDRVMYGSDFPNIPYAWDRELKHLEASGLTADRMEWILHKSATEFFNLSS
jgi:uncharacterized protein